MHPTSPTLGFTCLKTQYGKTHGSVWKKKRRKNEVTQTATAQNGQGWGGGANEISGAHHRHLSDVANDVPRVLPRAIVAIAYRYESARCDKCHRPERERRNLPFFARPPHPPEKAGPLMSIMWTDGCRGPEGASSHNKHWSPQSHDDAPQTVCYSGSANPLFMVFITTCQDIN